MKTLSIDIETYSDQPLAKTGVYRYVESPLRGPHRTVREGGCGTGAVAKPTHRPKPTGQKDGTLYPHPQETAGSDA